MDRVFLIVLIALTLTVTRALIKPCVLSPRTWKGVCKKNIMTGCNGYCWRQCRTFSSKRCLPRTEDGRPIRCKPGDHKFCANKGTASMKCIDSHMCRMESRGQITIQPPALWLLPLLDADQSNNRSSWILHNQGRLWCMVEELKQSKFIKDKNHDVYEMILGGS